MTETPPEDGGTPPVEGAGTTPETTSSESPPAATDKTEGVSTQDESSPVAPSTQSGSSANTTTTTVMKAASLPSPGTSSGGPVTTVYGKKSPDVWATKGWAEDASGKPNIASETITVETIEVANSGLADATAIIHDNEKATASWEPKGWVPDGNGGGSTPATGADAGAPGTWTPSGATPPADVAALQGGSITANPATAWTTGQYVQTATAGAPGEACWTGSGWVGGKAP